VFARRQILVPLPKEVPANSAPQAVFDGMFCTMVVGHEGATPAGATGCSGLVTTGSRSYGFDGQHSYDDGLRNMQLSKVTTTLLLARVHNA
jgi:hypothetical protein